MNADAKLAGFGLVLVATVGGGAAAGSAVGPIDVGESAEHGAGRGADQATGCSTSPSRDDAGHSAP